MGPPLPLDEHSISHLGLLRFVLFGLRNPLLLELVQVLQAMGPPLLQQGELHLAVVDLLLGIPRPIFLLLLQVLEAVVEEGAAPLVDGLLHGLPPAQRVQLLAQALLFLRMDPQQGLLHACPRRNASNSSLRPFSFCAWIRNKACSFARNFFSANLNSMSLMVLFFCNSSFNSLISWFASLVSRSLSACSRCSSASSCFTVAVASRSFFLTSDRRSCSRRSASTFDTKLLNDISTSSLFVSSSHSWTCALSACILRRLPWTFGF